MIFLFWYSFLEGRIFAKKFLGLIHLMLKMEIKGTSH